MFKQNYIVTEGFQLMAMKYKGLNDYSNVRQYTYYYNNLFTVTVDQEQFENDFNKGN